MWSTINAIDIYNTLFVIEKFLFKLLTQFIYSTYKYIIIIAD